MNRLFQSIRVKFGQFEFKFHFNWATSYRFPLTHFHLQINGNYLFSPFTTFHWNSKLKLLKLFNELCIGLAVLEFNWLNKVSWWNWQKLLISQNEIEKTNDFNVFGIFSAWAIREIHFFHSNKMVFLKVVNWNVYMNFCWRICRTNEKQILN